MTVKISTFSHKDTIKGKKYEWKDLRIVWNEEFSDLFGLGIFEQKKKKNPGNPGHAGCNFHFNSAKIKDAQTVFTIKKFDIVKVINILKGIADSFNMLRFAEMLA